MASALQYCFLILIFGIPMHECAAVLLNGSCVPVEPCFDLSVMANIAERVSKDVVAADGEKILLKHSSFDKIRKKKNLHSCVLQKIINLFQNVLEKTKKNDIHNKEELNHHVELIHIMDQLRNCVYKTKNRCKNLYKMSDITTTSSPMISEKNMNPNQLAVLQLQKLKSASKRLNDVQIQERVMDELKTLHLYMQGKGFRKNTRMTKEKHGVS
ncbi:uncharacterized protein LOC107725560 [Sinocyclocheilus rhinocerous]|uniref:uncharacterized protein LOC107725560 n=1 Tax=Sinocyclocheilus rhinocerous TaxID=307959 RepID=UPI0007BAB103|nr:PREDICTED: uncharacterized protein LOC107725560 [Sinocyclocheilus rhinocerous]